MSSGIDFDIDNDNRLSTSDNTEMISATPNPKSSGANPSANIDVWLFGGDIAIRDVSPFGGITLAYGCHVIENSRILVDGNVLLNISGVQRVPSGRETNHLLHTVAHEIGHVMTRDEHPGDEGYKSELTWDEKSDPFLQKRLMCMGGKSDRGKSRELS